MNVFEPVEQLKRQVEEVERQFAVDSGGADLLVMHDNGPHKHLVLSFPATHIRRGCEVVTWPGGLQVHGWFGSWAFHCGEEDLLDLFRPTPDQPRVNPLYWAQKIISGPGLREFDPEQAMACVRSAVSDALAADPSLTAEDAAAFLDWSDNDFTTEAGLARALGRFEGLAPGFVFPEETLDPHGFNPRFLYACTLLPWAVEQYDAALAPA